MIKLNSAIPLYQQVAEDLENRIEQGEFCSGQSIPSEAKLCEQYEVSRITIRNAIAELVEQEILVKYQGKGVFVRTPKISSSLTTFKGFTYFCQENHIKTYTKILENKVVSANAVMAKKLELKDGEKLVYLKRLRHVNDRPVMIEHVYLPYSKYGFLSKIDMENCSLYEKITEKTGLQMGYYAVKLLEEGKTNRVVALQQGNLVDYDIQEALKMKKPLDMDLYNMMMEISF